ncbi:hypothetical protein [Caenispirillum salinarum]|uniref:hypothetical protein n=1 Tax=Caenispirillum salinarum TaxID=859058 RepID=UPI00384D9507
MRTFILLTVSAAVGWAGLTYATVTRVPTVEVVSAPQCAAAAEDWSASLAAHGFEVVRKDQDAAVAGTPCLTGRAAGFDLEGAVPAADVERLIRKRPRGIKGLTMEGATGDQALTLNRDGTRSAFTPAPEKG